MVEEGYENLDGEKQHVEKNIFRQAYKYNVIYKGNKGSGQSPSPNKGNINLARGGSIMSSHNSFESFPN